MQNRKKKTQIYRTVFYTLWEKERVGCFKRTASKHVQYLGWNRSPAQVGCMRQVLRPGALGKPRGSGWRGRWQGGSGWGTHVNPWLFHANVWQNSLQIKKKKKKKTVLLWTFWYLSLGEHIVEFCLLFLFLEAGNIYLTVELLVHRVCSTLFNTAEQCFLWL